MPKRPARPYAGYAKRRRVGYAPPARRAARARNRMRRRRRRNPRVARGLNPAVALIKRSANYTVTLRGTPGEEPTHKLGGMTWTADGGMVWSVNAALTDVPNYTEFTSLYSAYKLMGLRITFTPGYTVRNTNPPQILMQWRRALNAVNLTSSDTRDAWNEFQAKKMRRLPRESRAKFSVYVPFAQLSEVENMSGTSTNVDVVRDTPRFVPITATTVRHIGHHFRFDTVDSTAGLSGTNVGPFGQLDELSPVYNVTLTYYLKLKGVR